MVVHDFDQPLICSWSLRARRIFDSAIVLGSWLANLIRGCITYSSSTCTSKYVYVYVGIDCFFSLLLLLHLVECPYSSFFTAWSTCLLSFLALIWKVLLCLKLMEDPHCDIVCLSSIHIACGYCALLYPYVLFSCSDIDLRHLQTRSLIPRNWKPTSKQTPMWHSCRRRLWSRNNSVVGGASPSWLFFSCHGCTLQNSQYLL